MRQKKCKNKEWHFPQIHERTWNNLHFLESIFQTINSPIIANEFVYTVLISWSPHATKTRSDSVSISVELDSTDMSEPSINFAHSLGNPINWYHFQTLSQKKSFQVRIRNKNQRKYFDNFKPASLSPPLIYLSLFHYCLQESPHQFWPPCHHHVPLLLLLRRPETRRTRRKTFAFFSSSCSSDFLYCRMGNKDQFNCPLWKENLWYMAYIHAVILKTFIKSLSPAFARKLQTLFQKQFLFMTLGLFS